jgi:hypothetical protein
VSEQRPAVERATPPTDRLRWVNRGFVRGLTWPRTARRIGRRLMLVHMTGRRSGGIITVPVAYHPGPDGTLTVVTRGVWRLNLRDRPDVDVTLLGERRPARAELVEDPAEVARTFRALIERLGHAKAGPRLGIRINVDRVPTLDELEDAVRRDGFSVVRLTLTG